MQNIYLVEDDAQIRELVSYTLGSYGYAVYEFEDSLGLEQALTGQELSKQRPDQNKQQPDHGRQRLDPIRQRPDLVILDIMLPGKDGIQILSELRKGEHTKKLPIILLTAKGSELDRVKGLNLGADDYITKPFSILELVARVKALLRRTEPPQDEESLVLGQLTVWPSKRLVLVKDEEIQLSFKEFELLSLLMKHAGIVLDRDRILNAIWGYEYDGENRTVDMHIKTLRQKLGSAGVYIKTVRNVGYKCEA
ncbi:MAG: response regulator transcription factor [Clostridium sp.]|jgi:two-component system alkaline phosphatase synthesis response regulator PhoP|nr:response regulator transcription factor [Clostridium sp.]